MLKCYILLCNTTVVGPVMQITVSMRLVLLQILLNRCSQETKESNANHIWPMDLQLGNPAFAYTTMKSK